MSTIGRITIPTPTASGLTFPLTSEYGYGTTRPYSTISHRFGERQTKSVQTYQIGIGPRKFAFKRSAIKHASRTALQNFYDSVQGSYQSFTYNAPNADGTTTAYQVIFETQPISFNELVNACQVGLTFIECPDPSAAPVYTIASTCTRFPNNTLATALTSDVQTIIPLVHIKVREAGVDEIYLSDRLVKVGNQWYQPRLLGIGDPSSDVLMSQNINGQSDSVQLQFGNADRLMTSLANDTDLKYASIDICLYHVQSGILLQLWKGVIQSYVSDGSPTFPITCSDGFFQIMNQYPKRQVSRQCWKTFNDGNYCPYSTQGSGGDSTKCDYYLESANGCQAHGMSKYFGGQQSDPQGVRILDNSTGFKGFGRNTVTATSIVSDTIWGLSLPEIWCNSHGDPNNAFITNGLMVAYRDEGDYADSLAIIGAGPLGGFTPSGVAVNADGYHHIVAPTVDGFTWQGFSVDLDNWSVTKNDVGVGLRQIQGNDPVNPASDYFSLGAGTPQQWAPNNYAAGVALCEARIQKPKGITPTTPDQHQMVVPLDYGLSGWVWNASGTRSVSTGLTNPYWISVNMMLRAMGLSGYVPTPLNLNSITSVALPSSGFFGYAGEHIGTFVTLAIVGWFVSPALEITALIGLIGSAFVGNAYSVPMSNAANQAEVVLKQNVSNWQNLPAQYKTTENQLTFATNFQTVWNAYVKACVVIYQGDPNGDDARKALARSISDRIPGGKWDWFSYYFSPIGTASFSFDSNHYLTSFSMTGGDLPGNTMTAALDLSAEQLDTFVLSSLVNQDGVSGCAQIADLQVPAILGAGDETQFQFQGVIASPKPFRDWITEVLNCCLGYYTWEFGKIKFGIRENASAVSAFTLGNTLYQSLRLTPVEAAFEKLVISYADVKYQYQANTAEYADKDHASYFGRDGAPLVAQMHSVGISTLSQALRIAATRVREECGGVTPAEWKAARVATFNTTILALDTEVGQVVSLTHPDVPGGTGDFRIQSWKLKKDWSIEIQAKTVTPSMYALDMGPKPIDVVAAPLPVMFYPQPLGEWGPYQVQADATDAIFPNEWTFDLAQASITMTDGTISSTLTVTGKLPVNKFISGCGAPNITTGSVTQSTSGGSLPDSTNIRVAVCAKNAAGQLSPPSKIILVKTGIGTASNQFTINSVQWPSVSGLTGYVIFASDSDDRICAQYTGTGTPSSITLTGPLSRSTWMLPNPDLAFLRMKVKKILHGGTMGAPVDSVSGTHIIASQTADIAGTDDWTGRKLVIAGRNETSTPFQSYTITHFNAATGDFTVDRTVTGVEIADAIYVTFKSYDNTADPYTFTDAGISNAADVDQVTKLPAPHTGLTTNFEVGNLVRIVAGYNRGAMAKIVANGATSYTFDRPFYMDATSIVFVESPNWDYQVDAAIDNVDPTKSTSITIPVENYLETSLLVGAFTVDVNGNESPDGDNLVRPTWVFGAGGSRIVLADDSQLTTDGRIFFDSTAGHIDFQLVSDVQVYGQPLVLQKISTDANTISIKAVSADDVFSDGTDTITLSAQGDTVLLRF